MKMSYVSLIISILAFVVALYSCVYKVFYDKRNFILNHINEIRNNLIVAFSDIGRFTLHSGVVLKGLDNKISEKVYLEKFLFEYYCVLAKSYEKIVLLLSGIKATEASVSLMKVYSKIIENLKDLIIRLKFSENYNDSLKNEVLQFLMNNELIKLDNLKLKVLIELNNYITDILKYKMSMKKMNQLITNVSTS